MLGNALERRTDLSLYIDSSTFQCRPGTPVATAPPFRANECVLNRLYVGLDFFRSLVITSFNQVVTFFLEFRDFALEFLLGARVEYRSEIPRTMWNEILTFRPKPSSLAFRRRHPRTDLEIEGEKLLA